MYPSLTLAVAQQKFAPRMKNKVQSLRDSAGSTIAMRWQSRLQGNLSEHTKLFLLLPATFSASILPRYDGILDLAAKQIHADFVTGLEVALWFLGWHAVDCMTGKAATVRGGAVSAARTGLVRVNASLGAVLSGGFTNLSIALFFAVSVWTTWESTALPE